jgi:hypothetical protein
MRERTKESATSRPGSMNSATIRDRSVPAAPANPEILNPFLAEESTDESVEELADTDQALESARVEGVEDAADHPGRPTHTHNEYARPDDLPPARGSRSS